MSEGDRKPRRSPLVVVAGATAALAAVPALWSGWSWYAVAHDDSAAYARARDTVLAAGEQAAQNMNTLDHRDLGPGLDLWESSTTGDLHDQLVQGRAKFEGQVRQAQTVTSAKALSGAVTELDDRAGRATVMIALRITVQVPNSAPATKDSRMLGELTRTPGGWKLSALGQAPMGDSAAAGQPSGAPQQPGPAPSGTAAPQPSSGGPSTPQQPVGH
ncbi:hypothetical protein [Kitasatospora herbaricolor]|uniref:Mce-associated membrane protein n=1 Tax=Kitasatospora herbaricolor TaxID=68217 RepID=A0ABZ1W3S0_9ACTN|nr:hypothetical protein [Kitasatospora herbaricolor]